VLDTLVGDFRFALRSLRKDRSFSAVAIATLALAIGANTAVFSLADGIILRPLAYRESTRLFAIHEVVPKFAHFAPLIPVNAMHFAEWRKNVKSFEELALVGGMTFNLTGSGEPERLPAARVSPSLFHILGVQAEIGRTFVEEEDRPAHDQVVVLDHELWQRRFAGDRGVIGRKIMLDGKPFEVVGVLPAGFRFPKISQLFAMTIAEERPQLWKPFALRKEEMDPFGDFNFACIARLRPGISPSRALAELNATQAAIVRGAPEKLELFASIVPLQDQITSRARSGLELLLAAVLAVLLIACVNIANLLLARAAARRREIAIRSALGAATTRLVRQVLVESVVLAGLGGALGMAIAYGAIRVMLAYAPLDLPRMDEIHVDARVLLFNVAISLLAGLLFGLLPAWRFSKADPLDAMRSGTRGAGGGHVSAKLRSLLVSLEAGLSVMCLIAAGLLVHSFVKLLHVDKGFQSDRVITVDLNLSGDRYSDGAKREALARALVERVGPLPGVISAGVSDHLPLTGEGGNTLVGIEGSNLPLMERPLVDVRSVNPDYFRTMGIPLVSGRLFSERDRGHKVTLIAAITAARLWPGVNPVGKRLRAGDDSSPLLEVVGVVGDVRGVSLNRPPNMTLYQPYWQRLYNQISVTARTAGNPLATASSMRAAIRQVDPELPMPAFRSMDEVVSESLAQRRFQMTLVLLFAAAAMLLASLGIYGVVSYSVTQRTAEIGLRMALGANPGRIQRMVLGQGMAPVGIGVAAGVAGSLLLGRVIGTLLFGVTAQDPATIAAVVLLLGAVAAVASYLPARRATHVDPMTALRWA